MFPGRTKISLLRVYARRGKEVMEEFTPEMVHIPPSRWYADGQIENLRIEVADYQRNMWANIGNKLGMTASGCKKQAEKAGIWKP